MMSKFLVVENDVVINVIELDGEADWQPQYGHTVELRTGEEWIGWNRVDGVWIPPAQPTPEPLTTEQLIALIESGVQAHLDAAADSLGYDDMKSAVTYAEEPAVAKFQNEGRALRAWRSLCWEKCYAELAKVHAGLRDLPTPEQAIAELPPFVLEAWHG